MKTTVTIKWVDADTQKPDSMTEVLIVANKRRVCLGHWNYSKKLWYEHESYDPVKVSYWAEKPLSPDYL